MSKLEGEHYSSLLWNIQLNHDLKFYFILSATEKSLITDESFWLKAQIKWIIFVISYLSKTSEPAEFNVRYIWEVYDAKWSI